MSNPLTFLYLSKIRERNKKGSHPHTAKVNIRIIE